MAWLICCVIFLYIVRKWLLKRNLAKMLTLKSKLSGKFQCCNAVAEILKCWKIVEFPKISIKMKNFKTFYKAQTASCLRETIQPSPPPQPPPHHQIKPSFVSRTNILWWRFTGIHRHLLSKCFENAVFRHLVMVQCKCFF